MSKYESKTGSRYENITGSRYEKKADPFYLSVAWRRCREAVLARDNYLCQYCLKQNKITPACLVHHVKPLEIHPNLALDTGNLISLCQACHDREHPEMPFVKLQRKIVVVLGYPAAGKTTYVRRLMRDKGRGADIILDLDYLVAAMTGREIHDRAGSAFHAVAIANDMISETIKNIRAKGYSFDTLYIVRTKLSDEEMMSLRAARAKFYWLDVDKDTCRKRLQAQGREDTVEAAFAKCDKFLREHGARVRIIPPPYPIR